MSEPVIIQLNPIPNQMVSCVLDGQNCVITVRQLGDALFLSLVSDGETILNTVLCNNGVPMPPFATAKFRGHLVLMDTIANKHPEYSQLGDRYVLIYDND